MQLNGEDPVDAPHTEDRWCLDYTNRHPCIARQVLLRQPRESGAELRRTSESAPVLGCPATSTSWGSRRNVKGDQQVYSPPQTVSLVGCLESMTLIWPMNVVLQDPFYSQNNEALKSKQGTEHCLSVNDKHLKAVAAMVSTVPA